MLGVAACFNNFKPGSRASTNNICKKKQIVEPFLTTSIYIKKIGRKIVVPCGLVEHKVELEELIGTMTINLAVQLLMKKYGISVPIPQTQEVKRYVYPTANKKLQFPVLAFNASFRVGGEALVLSPIPQPNFVIGKSYILEVCNDDTVTFSFTISDMETLATYWLSTLIIPCYCIVGPTNGQKNQLISGYISYDTNYPNRIIFTALIFNSLYLFYEEYSEFTNITIFYKTTSLTILTNYLNTNNLLDNFRNNAFNLI